MLVSLVVGSVVARAPATRHVRGGSCIGWFGWCRLLVAGLVEVACWSFLRPANACGRSEILDDCPANAGSPFVWSLLLLGVVFRVWSGKPSPTSGLRPRRTSNDPADAGEDVVPGLGSLGVWVPTHNWQWVPTHTTTTTRWGGRGHEQHAPRVRFLSELVLVLSPFSVLPRCFFVCRAPGPRG